MSRPSLLFSLFASPQTLPGVGPKLAKLLEKLDILKVRDLLFLAPFNLIDRSYTPALPQAQEGMIATLLVTVEQYTPPARPHQPFRIRVRNETGFLELALFNMKKQYVEQTLPLQQQRLISGRIERYRDQLQMNNPDYILLPSERSKLPPQEPVYPLTAGLTNKRLRLMIHEALKHLPTLPEWIEPHFLKQEKMPSWQEAILQLHNPQSILELDKSTTHRRRLAYDELLANQLAIALIRAHKRSRAGMSRAGKGILCTQLLGQLPFAPTACQQQARREIEADLAAPTQMLRLLQGDVGSGKTLVALMAMLTVIEAGYQAALMAPTEILARQHFASISRMCEGLPIKPALLTGREKGKAREELLAQLAGGNIQLLIGTHALFQDEVNFQNLGLAVVDEQHRFGVHQRLQITRKGEAVDMLVMTATPIPRTLLLTSYGDMAVSKLTEKPPGRTPISTKVLPLSRYDEVLEGIGRAIGSGARVYWVCPLVDESEESDLAAVTTRYTELSTRFPGQVVLAHGQQKGSERDAAMAAFAEGRASLLIATTVIEVGVDVPEASIMIIEHAERFGLAQLHQLRGRVGRGSASSSCLLLYAEPLGEIAKARLSIMRETEDGFRIAEEDLRLRGAGEVLGTRQSGLPVFRQADLSVHADLLATARDDANLILQRDPELMSDRGSALRILLHLYERQAAANYLRSG